MLHNCDYCVYYENWIPLVIDNGTNSIKAGFGGDDGPRTDFPTVIGRPRCKQIMVGMCAKDKYIGDEAKSKRGILALKYPIEKGIITNFDDMESIWLHTCYNELCLGPSEHEILLTESAVNPKRNREKMAEIMFETFQVPAICIESQETLSLFASGRESGVVINSGFHITNVVPVNQGLVIQNAVKTLSVGGDQISEYLANLLTESGYCFRYWKCKDIVNDIKTKLGYTAIDFEAEMNKKNAINQKYELPDGQEIEVGLARFKCSEAFFKPNLLGLECDGISKLLYESVMDCDGKLKCDLFNNVLLSGGGMLFDGIQNRLKNEMSEFKVNIDLVNGYIKHYSPSKFVHKDVVNIIHNHCDIDTQIIAPVERKYSAWIGGSIVCEISTFKERWICSHKYKEYGSASLHHKKVCMLY